MKKRFLILFIIVFITLNGCWSRRELDTLAIVTAIGIDKAKEDGKISVAFQILKPSEVKTPSSGSTGSGGSKGVWVLTSTGYTVFDAARNATMQSNRRLFFPQNKIIVIGEEMARASIAPLLDFLIVTRNPGALAGYS